MPPNERTRRPTTERPATEPNITLTSDGNGSAPRSVATRGIGDDEFRARLDAALRARQQRRDRVAEFRAQAAVRRAAGKAVLHRRRLGGGRR